MSSIDPGAPSEQAPSELARSEHTASEHTAAVAKQRGSRRGVAVAATLLVAAIVSAACDSAAASTPVPAGYNSGHGSHSGQNGGSQNNGGYTNGHGGRGHNGAPTATPTPGAPTPTGAATPTSAVTPPGSTDPTGTDPIGTNPSGSADPTATAVPTPVPTALPTAAPTTAPTAPPAGGNNGLDVLGRTCENSKLPAHTGFQISPACVSTQFGEVAGADKSPSLLITDAPTAVKVGQSFTLQVSTRNLVRDRFLGAAAGGYYLESSFLNDDGLQRGHFHTACRMLSTTAEAPDSSGAPAFFLATQDNKGGGAPDTVQITVTGMPSAGVAQCTSWAGDGSHRIPMMTRANQTPAVDSVRITVS